MKAILAKRHRGVLADFAYSNVLIGFDFDGTLAPIVPTPARARMRATTRRLLWRAATLYPCVVISGRTRGDLTNRLGRLPLWHVFGNHGLEPWAETTEASTQVREWIKYLRERLSDCAGVVIQDKRYTATVHYRKAPDRGRARAAIWRVVEALSNVRVLEGDHTVNLLPQNGANKGIALQRARRVLSCETAMYVGDDGVDEDAFASGPADQLLAIRVGQTRVSSAPYYLRSQPDIDRLLQHLVSLRSRGTSTVGRRRDRPGERTIA